MVPALPVAVVGVQHVVPELAFERVGQLVQPKQLVADGLNEHRQRGQNDRDLIMYNNLRKLERA